jgi:hypothetical protein
MTAKLLPAFLKCFEDDYISVRSEVCITCAKYGYASVINLAILQHDIQLGQIQLDKHQSLI